MASTKLRAEHLSTYLFPITLTNTSPSIHFAKDETSIGTTPLSSMTMDTGNSDPVSQKPYPIGMKHYQWVKEEIEKLLTAKVICSSRSSWSVLILVVPKGDGGKQLVIDYRALNKVTRKFTWPMPKVEEYFPN